MHCGSASLDTQLDSLKAASITRDLRREDLHPRADAMSWSRSRAGWATPRPRLVRSRLADYRGHVTRTKPLGGIASVDMVDRLVITRTKVTTHGWRVRPADDLHGRAAAHERGDYWRHLVSSIHSQMDSTYQQPEDFRGRALRQWPAADQIVGWRSAEERVIRTASAARRTGDDSYAGAAALRGAVAYSAGARPAGARYGPAPPRGS